MRRVVRVICGEMPPALAGLLLVAVIAMAVSTRQHAAVWRSESALWAYAVRVAPQKPRTLNNYAVTLVMQGQFTEARTWFERAHQAGQSPTLPPWDRVEGERSARANLQAIDAILAEGH